MRALGLEMTERKCLGIDLIGRGGKLKVGRSRKELYHVQMMKLEF